VFLAHFPKKGISNRTAHTISITTTVFEFLRCDGAYNMTHPSGQGDKCGLQSVRIPYRGFLGRPSFSHFVRGEKVEL